MSLQVLYAHTGERWLADPVSFSSLEAFRSWLENTTSVAAANQILLTTTGKQVKVQALLAESQIFLYDRSVTSLASRPAGNTVLDAFSASSIAFPEPPPDSPLGQDDLITCQNLFKARQAWALDVMEKNRAMASEAQKHLDARTVIERGLAVALGNLASHVRTLEQKYADAQSWTEQVIQEQEALLESIQATMAQLQSLPASMTFFHFLPKLAGGQENANGGGPKDITSLKDFVAAEELRSAAATVKAARSNLLTQLKVVEKLVTDVVRQAGQLVRGVEIDQAQSVIDGGNAASQLMEEIEVISQKLTSDYEHVLSLPTTTKSVAQASKMASLHTRNYLPSLKEYCLEMGDIVRQTVDLRKSTASLAISTMRSITSVESAYAQANTTVTTLDVPKDALAALEFVALIAQLPFVYGSLLVEAVRRREWSQRIKNESAILAEDIAGYREEEDRRRKRWLKNIGNLVGEVAGAGDVLNFQIDLQAEENEWPEVSRNDILDYLQALRKLHGLEDTIEELSEAVKDLDRPTKRQIKKVNNFKMGSVHEAVSGKGSFLLRENDELKILRENNAKLKDDVKSQKSRIRKLEDMLYKQGLQGRSTSANNLFQVTDGAVLAPALVDSKNSSPGAQDMVSRQSSVVTRRVSSSHSTEERTLARRIVSLEADLLQEKQKRDLLERETLATKDKEIRMIKEIGESRSTKKDLMENMDAQQREFADERRLLEEEVNRHKLKIEELEDELERLLGSRDNERNGADDRYRGLQAELERRAREIAVLKDEMQRRLEIQEEQNNTLRGAYLSLSPEGKAPESTVELVNALDEVVQRASRHARDLALALEAAKADSEDLRGTMSKQDIEMSAAKAQSQALEKATAILRTNSAAERAKSQALATELEDGRDQLRKLRAKFAEGETGSETLRQRVEELAARAAQLAAELAESKSHVNSLDVELTSLQWRHSKLLADFDRSSRTLERQSHRASELSEMLITRNEELARLLETLGLSMATREGTMIIQRACKVAGTTDTVILEPGGLSGQPSTLPLTTAQPFNVCSDRSLTDWAHAESFEEETEKFSQLMAMINSFNLNTFSEAIIKLRRDIEWTGKKWKMEARSYRDKRQRAQSEAHDKIAFRSFKEGDLALFLPTRNQANRPWAAFNIGAPHYFLREQEAHKLRNREWIVARISKLEERVVDMSKTMDSLKGADGRSIAETSEGGVSFEDDNPFELQDGLRWYLLDAIEEKSGAPATPGLGTSTVASAHVDVKGSIRMKKSPAGNDASTKLNKNLESRRGSMHSKRGSVSSRVSKDGASDTGVTAIAVEVDSKHSPNNELTAVTAASNNNHVSVETAESTEELGKMLGSPPKSSMLGGLFGTVSPPKSWLGIRETSSSKSIHATSAPEAPDRLSKPISTVAKPISAHPSPGKSARSPSTSPTTVRPTASAWDSLWALDVTVERGPSKSPRK